MLKHDWTLSEAEKIYYQPFTDLVFEAQNKHRLYFSPTHIQRSTLLSVKTGGCPENCKYCPQSAHYDTGLTKHKLLPEETVLAKANEARMAGSTRFCMGAAWREVKDGPDFDQILGYVSKISATGMEVCCTLGMLTLEQACKLKAAGCYAYNHNLDTSPEYYGEVISTRVYEDRLRTLANVREAGITVCCGGIIGMGESISDRLKLLVQLANQNPHPESVPINLLIRIEGTPLAKEATVDPLDFVRIIAAARILMPASMVRLSAGRSSMSAELHALCFLAGANSVFTGERLLTAENPTVDQDEELIKSLGLSWYNLDETLNSTIDTVKPL